MKRLYKYLVFGVLIVTMHACKKELGALPKNAKVDANTILDQPTAQIALNGAYYDFSEATQTKTGWQHHEIKPAFFAGFMVSGVSTTNYLEDAENRYNNTTDYFWNGTYVLLNSANGVLKGVNALSDDKFTGNTKKEIIAQAHFLRAYAHFRLLIFYAEWYKADSPLGVLLRDELSALGNISKARSSVKESYDFILSDLDDAIANAPAASAVYYATKWSAMALKMRVLISRGLPADYTTVISLADNIIQNSPFTLEPKAEDIFHRNGLASKEVILGIKPQAAQELDYYSKSAQYWPGHSDLYVATARLKSLYDNDPRQSWMIGSANAHTNVPNTFYFTKYIQVGGVPSQISETDYVLRLTEVFLLKAEAIVRSGGNLTDARAVVHQVQEKAGITATTNNAPYLAVENAGSTADLLVEIFKETSKSLVGEDGMEWMALLRLPFDTVKQLKPTITNQIQYILPVPPEEFIYNPSFGDQNPGYSKQ